MFGIATATANRQDHFLGPVVSFVVLTAVPVINMQTTPFSVLVGLPFGEENMNSHLSVQREYSQGVEIGMISKTYLSLEQP